MRFDPARVRAGEWIMGISALALLLSAFLLPWYGIKSPYSSEPAREGFPVTVDAWNGLATLRFLIVIAGGLGLLVLYLQGTRRSPALPVCFTVITSVVATITLLGLVDRVLFNVPQVLLAGAAGINVTESRGGAYAGLLFAFAIVVGGYISLREDGIAAGDAPQEIETLRLLRRAPAS